MMDEYLKLLIINNRASYDNILYKYGSKISSLNSPVAGGASGPGAGGMNNKLRTMATNTNKTKPLGHGLGY